ncbi:MAG TPA: exodeoxyribonuclease V subunit gamma [Methylococcaceae bacterium]|nr:exodeoxyribonuclease V subunit gamma [Methylococcaceae bacterium]
MLIVHSSNKSENLMAHLVKVLETRPLSSPFVQEQFLVQSQGMERWVCQQLAVHFPVWANYQFLFPGKFFNDLIQRLEAGLTCQQFSRERMLWLIEDILRRSQEPALTNYLSGTQLSLKRFQLAKSLAQIFDQYQMMRPDWLNAWENDLLVTEHVGEQWQQQLWKEIVTLLGHNHRGAAWLEAIALLDDRPEGFFSEQLPERVSILGVNAMPPLLFNLIQSLSAHCEVHLYLLQPSQYYWNRSNANPPLEKNLIGNSVVSTVEVIDPDHPLLTSLGQLAWDFQALLLQAGRVDQEFTSFDDHDGVQRTNLQQLQSDLLNNSCAKINVVDDGTIRFHACHSRLREVEVLKDQLLATFESNVAIALHDVLIMAPNIQDYSPYIAAVFEDIPYTLADRNLKLNNPLVDCFIGFLTLSQSRVGWRDVMSVLEQPAVCARFDLNVSRLNIIRYWIKELGICWGLSEQHKHQFDLPGGEQNTWRNGLNRLMMGYLMGDGEAFVSGLPHPGVGENEAEALGGLYCFIHLLSRVESELKQSRSRSEWVRLLTRFTEQLFVEDINSEAHLLELNMLLVALSDESDLATTVDIEFSVIIDWLKGVLSETKSSNGFLRGQLTFCSLLPMRSIPFKVIALLGMNDGEFPKNDQFQTIDLMGVYKRSGDRSRCLDDRYQFLEVILSVRERLIVTYIGQSDKTNERLSPALVICELHQVLETQYDLNDLIIKHPLNSFSSRYFEEGSQLDSLSEMDFQTAIAINDGQYLAPPWWQGSIERKPEGIILFQQLVQFFKNPQRYFFKHSLGLELGSMSIPPDEKEPFSVLGLAAYSINQQWIEDKLQHKSINIQQLQAEGHWPDGALAEVLFSEKDAELAPFIALLQSHDLGERIEDLYADLHVGDYQLTAQFTNCYQWGGLMYRYANLKGADFMAAVLRHSLINQIKPQRTHLVTKNKTIIIPNCFDGRVELKSLLNIYSEGLSAPSALYIEPAFAYINQHKARLNSSRIKKMPLEVAHEMLEQEKNYGATEIRLLGRHLKPGESLLGTAFEAYCLDVLLPLWDQVDVQDTL